MKNKKIFNNESDVKNFKTNNKTNYGFFILRHVNSFESDKLWQLCYDKIRYFYPKIEIIIIDDNSQKKFLTKNKKLINCKIVNSEFKKRGELLPYYYFLKLKPFDKMIFFHDGHYIEKFINFNLYENISLFGSDHYWNNDKLEVSIINKFKNNKILKEAYNKKKKWTVFFGATTIITYDKLKYLNDKYNFINICLVEINNRERRMVFERIIGLLICLETKNKITLLGNIHHYLYWAKGNYRFNYTKFKDYQKIKKLNPDLPIIKIFSGR